MDLFQYVVTEEEMSRIILSSAEGAERVPLEHRSEIKTIANELLEVFRPQYDERAIVETFEGLLHHYFYHPESKSLGPDGEPCQQNTRGRLRRPYVIGGKHHHIGKEVDRRWEEGDDLEAMRQTPIEYTRKASRAPHEPLIQPSLSLSRSVKNIGIRKLIRQGFGRRIIEKISRRELVKASTYRDYERRIEEYARRRQRPKHSV